MSYPLAAHLLTRRGGRVHHGFHASIGMVLEWTAGGIHLITIDEFSGGHAVSVAPDSGGKKLLSAAAAIARAGYMLKDEGSERFFSDDEHFVRWCLSEDYALAAHLATPRTGYVHHGIYAGSSMVIERTRHGILRSTLDAFAEGHPTVEVPHPFYQRKIAPEESIRRAESMVGRSDYDLLFNNCEHFISWCIFDEKRSLQVETVMAALDAAGVPIPEGMAPDAGQLPANPIWKMFHDLTQSLTKKKKVRSIGKKGGKKKALEG